MFMTKKPPGSDKLEWNIHFWLGKETSQDEQGVAAYKTVELDDSLGGAPVQYREVQDHESKLFLSYFKSGIKYLSGGIDSGFKKVERGKYEKRLFHIKGKKSVRARQVKTHCSSLNKGDVFLLDTGRTLHLWIGPNSSMFERMKGIEIANRIRDEERSGKVEIRIIDNRWSSDGPFFKDLGSQGTILEASHGGDDYEYEKNIKVDVKLYRVSDSSGKLEVTEIAKRPLHQQDLDTNDCFILDSGPSGIFVWVGKSCTKNEKKSAWSHATHFLQYKGYPDWTKVTRVVEDGETPVFKQYFSSWQERDEQIGLGRTYSLGNIAKIDNTPVFIDFDKLHLDTRERESRLPDDGTGEIEVWRVLNNDLVPVDSDTLGAFFSSSSYVLLYTYEIRNKPRYIIYYWQGSRSSVEDKAAAAIFAKKLDDEELSGSAEQIRVEQGKEPDHFLQIFKGRMIVFMDDTEDEGDEPTDSKTQMFHVRGTNDRNTRAVEVPPLASSLNSSDVFFVIGEFDTYVWVGKMSETIEFETAKKLIDFLTPDRSLVLTKENEEPPEFWELIGGKGIYAKSIKKEKNKHSKYPRLFLCSNTSGRFSVEEIRNFSQDDLAEGDVAILDTFDEIFVWIGKKSNDIERKEALKAAMRYERQVSSENEIVQQQETRIQNDVTDVREELERYDKTYPYKELIKKRPPTGVDVTCKEKYLSDEEFEQVFGITKEEFYSLPKWRQVNHKKKVELF